MNATTTRFINEIAENLIADIQAPNKSIKRFTNNSMLIGAFVEQSVRRLVKRFVEPLKVSTGTVIDEQSHGEYLPQIDTIIWGANPVPAICEVGDFGLIPRGSAFGILEIKSSAYSAKAIKHIDTVIELADSLTFGHADPTSGVLGVICAQENGQHGYSGDHADRVVTLFTEDEQGNIQPQHEHVIRLVNFLAHVRLVANSTMAKGYGLTRI